MSLAAPAAFEEQFSINKIIDFFILLVFCSSISHIIFHNADFFPGISSLSAFVI